jgi:uncharacterized phiE125 gp8 family phage protein
MAARCIVQPTVEPVSIAEAANALRIDDTSELQAELQSLITTARQALEGEMGHAFCEQTWELALDAFPAGAVIVLPRATPLLAVTSIKYTDINGVEHTVPASDYIADTAVQPGRVVLKDSANWPSADLLEASAVRIRYTCGTADTSPVEPFPESLKRRIILDVRDLLDHPAEGPAGASYEEAYNRTRSRLAGGRRKVWAF